MGFSLVIIHLHPKQDKQWEKQTKCVVCRFDFNELYWFGCVCWIHILNFTRLARIEMAFLLNVPHYCDSLFILGLYVEQSQKKSKSYCIASVSNQSQWIHCDCQQQNYNHETAFFKRDSTWYNFMITEVYIFFLSNTPHSERTQWDIPPLNVERNY